MRENTIKQLSDRDHCLQRPGIYIGSTTNTICNTYILDKKSESFTYKEIEYNPGLLKIIYEILDNSLDEGHRCNFQFGNKISIDINNADGEIIIKDNGRGIPLSKAQGSDKSQFEIALTELRSGSNFNDAAEGRISLGMNGVGSSLTVIYSKEFKAISRDGKQEGTLICMDNMSTKECNIIPFKCGKKDQGTTIIFKPDLKRFGLRKIGDIHANLIHQRLMFLSYLYPEIEFQFNGEKVQFKNVKNLMNAFSEQYVAIQDQNKPCKYLIGIIPNHNDDFTHKSYINGADCINGGNHLDYIHSELVNRIKDKLAKKYSSIKPGDIKNKLSYIICFREFINPMFNSQTKENFSSDVGEIKKFLANIDWDALVQKIVKTPAIIDPIIESFKIKEELKNRQALAGMSKPSRKFKCDKYLPATKQQKYFFIVEGDSACGGLMDGLGRSEMGYFATRGVPLNAYDAKISKITENKELENLTKILNLRLGAESQNISYENIVLANDSDADGSHIAGLYIGFFSKFAKSIIENKRLFRLRTPIVCLRNAKNQIEKMFFNLVEYKEYEKNNSNSKLISHYYKGLGSWKAKDLKELVNKYGLDYFLEPLVYDEESTTYIHNWMDGKEAESRKEYLRNYSLDLDKI